MVEMTSQHPDGGPFPPRMSPIHNINERLNSEIVERISRLVVLNCHFLGGRLHHPCRTLSSDDEWNGGDPTRDHPPNWSKTGKEYETNEHHDRYPCVPLPRCALGNNRSPWRGAPAPNVWLRNSRRR